MPDVTVREGRQDTPAPAIRSSDDLEGVMLKVCGITDRPEIGALAAHSVDFAGLWYGVPGGPADLELPKWQEVRPATAAQAGGPGAGTLSKDGGMLRGR